MKCAMCGSPNTHQFGCPMMDHHEPIQLATELAFVDDTSDDFPFTEYPCISEEL